MAGQVEVQGRQATLTLTLPYPTPEAEVKMCRPTTENIEAKIDAGTVKVHPTRQPVTKKMITNAMGNVQRMLLLPGGASGGWNPRAQVRLEAPLAKPILSKIAKPLRLRTKRTRRNSKTQRCWPSKTSSPPSRRSLPNHRLPTHPHPLLILRTIPCK